ncbi:MAG: methylmalonyl-CoA/ethylmalonyl-CoA epimerase [Gammaproteobacteria bacterium]|jgi:methylmalonyl-CoA/ethylmalonyl-CoA epimerase
MLKRVHHINFVVHDLEAAVIKYQTLFGLDNCEYLNHPHRPVKTARFKIGDSWIVLLQPLDTESLPAQHLQEKGEGFFLISFEVDDLDAAMKRVEEKGGILRDETARPGILNWQVADLDPDSTFGALIQLVEERD